MNDELENELLNHLLIAPKEHSLTDEQMEQLRPALLLMAYAEKTLEKGFYGDNVIVLHERKLRKKATNVISLFERNETAPGTDADS